MKKNIFFIVFASMILFSCEKKQDIPYSSTTLQDDFDNVISNNDYEGIKLLKGKKYLHSNSGLDYGTSGGYSLSFEKGIDSENQQEFFSLSYYIPQGREDYFVIFLTKAFYKDIEELRKNGGASIELTNIQLFQARKGYTYFLFHACYLDEYGDIQNAPNVFCLRESKVNTDGSYENITVWYKKIVPDYVIEVLSPEEFVITKGEDSEYFYYYDENHY